VENWKTGYAKKGGKRRVFYGWYLLAAGTAVLAIHGATFTYGFAVFFLPLATTLNVSRGLLSTVFSLTRLESALLGPVDGYLIDRFGPRKILLLGALLFGTGFFLFSRIESLMHFFLVFALLALGGSLAGFLPVTTAVQNWFSRRRGMATGISAAGVNIGGSLVVFVAMMITLVGWRSMATLIALVIWIAIPPLALLIRHRPQDYGYLPDGDQPQERETETVDGTPSGESVKVTPVLNEGPDNFTPMQALRTRAFYLVAIAHSFSLLIVGSVTIHTIPRLVDAGVSYEAAALILTITTIVAVLGRMSGGYLGDRVGRKVVIVASFIMMAAGMVVLATAESFAQATVFAVLYGLGYGARAPLLVALRADYFGPKHFATIMGFSQLVMIPGMFLGPVISGFAYDIQGSYVTVFTVIAIIGLIGAVLVVFLKPPVVSSA